MLRNGVDSERPVEPVELRPVYQDLCVPFFGGIKFRLAAVA
jgi:hypothetical protein